MGIFVILDSRAGFFPRLSCSVFSREWRRQNRNAARTPLVAVKSWRTLIGSNFRQSSLWRPSLSCAW